MTNKRLSELRYKGHITDSEYKELKLAIKTLDIVERLENMRDNAYGRKQVLGTVHSDLEELLEVFEEAENEVSL